jgi:cytochrome P450
MAPTDSTASTADGCPVDHAGLRLTTRAARRARRPRGVPSYSADIFSRSAILDPYPHYAAMRELGPVVWLSKNRVYALPRHGEVKQVLADDATFVSGKGVGLNPVINAAGQGTTLISDGEVHRMRRQLVAHRLTPRALRPFADQVAALAEAVVVEAVGRSEVDGVEDVALKLPMTVVPDFIGWPEDGRDSLLRWGGATFDLIGPTNGRAIAAIPDMLRAQAYIRSVVREDRVIPGSMSHEVLEAARAGQIAPEECPKLMFDYMAPSLDTTASAIAAALWLFATNPEQWDRLKANPDLVPAAVQEVVRIEAPLRAFSRIAAVDAEIAGTPIPAGARLLVMYASANRDERVFPDPDRFDISRDASAHVGFGYGTHGCAGQGLARLETQAILRALLTHVERIELAGDPTLAVNNVIHRFETLPVRLVPRSTASAGSDA